MIAGNIFKKAILKKDGLFLALFDLISHVAPPLDSQEQMQVDTARCAYASTRKPIIEKVRAEIHAIFRGIKLLRE